MTPRRRRRDLGAAAGTAVAPLNTRPDRCAWLMEATTNTVRATVTGILLDGDVSTVHAAHDRHLCEALRHPAVLHAVPSAWLPMVSAAVPLLGAGRHASPPAAHRLRFDLGSDSGLRARGAFQNLQAWPRFSCRSAVRTVVVATCSGVILLKARRVASSWRTPAETPSARPSDCHETHIGLAFASGPSRWLCEAQTVRDQETSPSRSAHGVHSCVACACIDERGPRAD